MLRPVTLVRTDVSEELSASIIRVTRMDELATTLALSSNRHRHDELSQLLDVHNVSDVRQIEIHTAEAGPSHLKVEKV
jgi:hypothetical protein